MENASEQVEQTPELSPMSTRRPENLRLRRRLVQATLLPHKSSEPVENGSQEEEGKDCGDDSEEFYVKGSRKKRRTTAKQPKEKRAASLTPKKNGLKTHCEDSPPSLPDLRQEAKMRAEENSRMFAGRQIHPFFSSWKVGKKCQEATDIADNPLPVGRKDKGIKCGPIHVFERMEDDMIFLDWSNWTFCKETFSNRNLGPESTCTSIFEGSVKSLTFDGLPTAMNPLNSSAVEADVSSDKCLNDQDLGSEMLPTLSIPVAEGKMLCYNISAEAEMDSPVDKLCGRSRFEANSVIDHESRSHQERVSSCSIDNGNEPTNSLWTYKYRPRKAMEVCGNHESVNFLSEWLQRWKERNFLSVKDSIGGDKHKTKRYSSNFSERGSDSESSDEEASLKNVLLIIGPAGSGKSAAIYACAEEQGFRVSEFSASFHRSGANLKQMIGEALQSHQLEWKLANLESKNKCIDKSLPSHQNNAAVQESLYESNEVAPLSTESSHDVIAESGDAACMESEFASDRCEVKPLILLEDVDIVFQEDRGFISAIQEIAETGRGPIILTSNCYSTLLPDNLDRLQVIFELPSAGELLRYLNRICVAEGKDIQPKLLQKLIVCCDQDIRKVVTHFQFWCQGKGSGKDGNMQQTYSPLLFDTDAGHQIQPNIIPWSFPSRLSEVIDKEIAKSLSIVDTRLVDSRCEDEKIQNSLAACENEMDIVEEKRLTMLSKNSSVHNCTEFTTQFHTACDFVDNSSSPISFSKRRHRRKLDMVVSSDSEDQSVKESPVFLQKDACGELGAEQNGVSSDNPDPKNCSSPSFDELVCSRDQNINEHRQTYLESACHEDTSEACMSVDASWVPESTYVPESEFDHETGLLSQASDCCDYTSDTNKVPVESKFMPDLLSFGNDNLEKGVSGINFPDVSGFTGYVLADSYQDVEETCQNENMEAVTRGYHVMDECSRMDFSKSKPVEKPTLSSSANLVQESWKQLRFCCTNLKEYAVLENPVALQIIDLAYKMSNVFSDSDLLHSASGTLENTLETSTALVEKSDRVGQYDGSLEMASTISQHGFCCYARDVAAIGSTINCDYGVKIASDMLASTANVMAVGKLLRQDMRKSRISFGEKNLEKSSTEGDFLQQRETKSHLFGIVQSTVPAKSYKSMKGVAFLEYLSSLRCISRSEASRLSKSTDKTKGRRKRVAGHYLMSSGTLMLSPEDVEMLDRSNLR